MGYLVAMEMVEVAVVPVRPAKLLELHLVLPIKAVMVVQVVRHLYQAQVLLMLVVEAEPDIKTLLQEPVEVEMAGVMQDKQQQQVQSTPVEVVAEMDIQVATECQVVLAL
jgi:hypothetical protein